MCDNCNTNVGGTIISCVCDNCNTNVGGTIISCVIIAIQMLVVL